MRNLWAFEWKYIKSWVQRSYNLEVKEAYQNLIDSLINSIKIPIAHSLIINEIYEIKEIKNKEDTKLGLKWLGIFMFFVTKFFYSWISFYTNNEI